MRQEFQEMESLEAIRVLRDMLNSVLAQSQHNKEKGENIIPFPQAVPPQSPTPPKHESAAARYWASFTMTKLGMAKKAAELSALQEVL